MSRHRFINDGRSPIPMGGSVEYACVCGKRGTREVIARHVIDNAARDNRDARDAAPIAPYDRLVDGDDIGGGTTQAHYLPMEPRAPAPTTFDEEEITPPDRPSPRVAVAEEMCTLCGTGASIVNLPEIAIWSCGHWIHKRPRSIAESFQDMLRSAFQAGAVSTTIGESFETWYQREVLQ